MGLEPGRPVLWSPAGCGDVHRLDAEAVRARAGLHDPAEEVALVHPPPAVRDRVAQEQHAGDPRRQGLEHGRAAQAERIDLDRVAVGRDDLRGAHGVAEARIAVVGHDLPHAEHTHRELGQGQHQEHGGDRQAESRKQAEAPSRVGADPTRSPPTRTGGSESAADAASPRSRIDLLPRTSLYEARVSSPLNVARFRPLLLSLVVVVSLLAPGMAQAYDVDTAPFMGSFGFKSPNPPGHFTMTIQNAVHDATGNVYVVESLRVQKFDRDGNFLLTWACYSCSGIDVNQATGDVYVTLYDLQAIRRYSANGVLLGGWGGWGSGPGLVKNPHGIAVDPTTGSVYVFDTGNGRVQVFDANGVYQRAFGHPGTGPADFSGLPSPGSVAFDAVNRVVYVTDPRIYQVKKFAEDGTFIRKWGDPVGGEPGHFRWPRSVEVDGDGRVFVTDTDSERIQYFTPDGDYLGQFQGPNSVAEGAFHPRDIAINRLTGEKYVNAAYAFREDKFDANNQFVLSWGGRDLTGPQIEGPHGIAVSPVGGDVYLVDSTNMLIKRFSAGGAFIKQWGGSNRIDVSNPGLIGQGTQSALGVGPDGRVWTGIVSLYYLSDPPGPWLTQFDPDGTVTNFLTRKPFVSTYDEQVRDVAVEPVTGDLFVADAILNRIRRLSSTGVAARGSPGRGGRGARLRRRQALRRRPGDSHRPPVRREPHLRGVDRQRWRRRRTALSQLRERRRGGPDRADLRRGHLAPPHSAVRRERQLRGKTRRPRGGERAGPVHPADGRRALDAGRSALRRRHVQPPGPGVLPLRPDELRGDPRSGRRRAQRLRGQLPGRREREPGQLRRRRPRRRVRRLPGRRQQRRGRRRDLRQRRQLSGGRERGSGERGRRRARRRVRRLPERRGERRRRRHGLRRRRQLSGGRQRESGERGRRRARRRLRRLPGRCAERRRRRRDLRRRRQLSGGREREPGERRRRRAGRRVRRLPERRRERRRRRRRLRRRRQLPGGRERGPGERATATRSATPATPARATRRTTPTATRSAATSTTARRSQRDAGRRRRRRSRRRLRQLPGAREREPGERRRRRARRRLRRLPERRGERRGRRRDLRQRRQLPGASRTRTRRTPTATRSATRATSARATRRTTPTATTVCGAVDNCPARRQRGSGQRRRRRAGRRLRRLPGRCAERRRRRRRSAATSTTVPALANASQANADGDALGDACDVCPGDAANDADGDARLRRRRQLPGVANADQANGDGDALGDACDLCPSDAANDVDGDARLRRRGQLPGRSPTRLRRTPTATAAATSATTARRSRTPIRRTPTATRSATPATLPRRRRRTTPTATRSAVTSTTARRVANPDQANADGDALGDACDACPTTRRTTSTATPSAATSDNCPFASNVDQADSGGVDSPTPDGVGDACQCGDVASSGIVEAADLAAYRAWLADDVSATSFDAPAKCRVSGSTGSCTVLDSRAAAARARRDGTARRRESRRHCDAAGN